MPDTEKLKHFQQKITGYGDQLRDLRVVGLVVFVVIVLMISWSGVKAIETNYTLQRQLSGLKQAQALQRLKNENQKLENTYYASRQYQDIAARQNLGLAAPGETVLIVPKNVALRYTVDLPDDVKEETAKAKAKQPAYQRNFQAWMNFFMHRPQTTDRLQER